MTEDTHSTNGSDGTIIQYVVVPKSRLVNFKFKPIYIAVWSGRIRRIEIVNAGEHERKSFFAKTILRCRYIHNLRLRLYDVNKYYISERVLNAQRKNSVIIDLHFSSFICSAFDYIYFMSSVCCRNFVFILRALQICFPTNDPNSFISNQQTHQQSNKQPDN